MDNRHERVLEISNKIFGKIVSGIEFEEGYDDYLLIKFLNAPTLRIRYDWIYAIELEEANVVG